MAKLNEGDIIEGIFAIALGVYVADDGVTKERVNFFRTKIEPKIFSSGRASIQLGKMIKKQRGKNPPDFFNVDLEIRLKEASVTGAYGKQFQILYESSKDVGNIDNKINQIISSQTTSSWAKKMSAARDNFLKNSIGEIITFQLVADGIAGESSGGEIKADIDVTIYATKKSGKTKIFDEKVGFSLKSESVTVANLSPYNGMKDLARALNLEWKDIKKYEVLGKTARTDAEKNFKFKIIKEMFEELKSMIVSSKKNISKDAFIFLRKSIFGSDLANVVDVQSKGVKEITPEYFDEIQKTTTLHVLDKGNSLVFVDSKTNVPIFQLRTKLRPPPAANGAGEAKFYLEVGKGVYD